MFSFVVILSLWGFCHAANSCPNAGKVPLANRGRNNYVIDWLELIDGVFVPFPFAIGQCTSHSLVTNRIYIHTCVNDVVSTQEYRDSRCNTPRGQPVVSRTINYYGPGEVGYFECDGSNTYAELFSATNASRNNACSNLRHIFAGLNGCVDETEVLGQTLSIYCDSRQTLFQWFVQTAQSSGRRALAEFGNMTNNLTSVSSYYPSSSEHPESSEYPSSSLFPNMSSSHFPLTTVPSSQLCGSDFYCQDWIVQSSSSCQRIGDLQGTNIGVWGNMGICQENGSAGVSSNLTMWISVIITILYTLTH